MSNRYNGKTVDQVIQEIKRTVTVDGPLPMSHHPLYQHVWSTEDMEMPENMREYCGKRWFRRFIKQKLVGLENARNEGDWDTYVFLHERPYRADVLAMLVTDGQLAFADHARLARSVWVDSEVPHQSIEEWRSIFTTCLGADAWSRWMLNGDELADRDREWPRRLYRGVRHLNSCSTLEATPGFAASWTSSEKTARWFAERFPAPDGMAGVYSAMFEKADVIGPINARGESEYLWIDGMHGKAPNELPDFICEKV